MPVLRPFRALRYDTTAVPDLAQVICPPYDVIPPEHALRLAARHPHNAVRLELPLGQPRDEPGARYRRAARELVSWRTQGILRKDREPSVYVYEQVYRVPGATVERNTRGFFARLKLEPWGGGIRPHERTMSGPKEDRYALLRATGLNSSPIVALYEGARGDTASALDAVAVTQAAAEARDDDGVCHRLWAQPVDDSPAGAAAARLLELAGAGPLTIADGHHRYETGLRYRDERGANRACESDPAYDYVLSLLHDVDATPLTILATHRLVPAGGRRGDALLEALAGYGGVEALDSPAELRTLFRTVDAPAAVDAPRLGVWTGGRAALFRPRAESLAWPAEAGSDTLRGLSVTVLAAVLEGLLGIDAERRAAGAIGYTKDVDEALGAVDAGAFDAAFLLDPTPVRAVIDVAAAGDVMPQKSTYFYPKAAAGLVFNPHEG